VAALVGVNSDDPPLDGTFHEVRFERKSFPYPVVGMSDVMPYRSTRWRDLNAEDLVLYRKLFSKALRTLVKSFSPDLIHCHHLWVLTALCRELFPSLRVVAGCHGTGLRQQEKLPELAEAIRPRLLELDHIFVLNRSQLQLLDSWGVPLTRVGAGFDSSLFYSGQGERRGVLYAGKLARSKGCLELLEAARGAPFELRMAGSGEDEVVNRAREVGAVLLGRLTQEELAAEMRRAHTFVLPSYFEGLPLVLAEALACGCRVVTTELSGVMEWIPAELVESGWVTFVPLPRLRDSDQPYREDIPEFVRRLREVLVGLGDPAGGLGELEQFLRGNSWEGVFQKMVRHYR